MKRLLASLLLCLLCFSLGFAEELSPQKIPPRGSLRGGMRTKHTNLTFKRGKADNLHYVFILFDENNAAVETGFMGAKDKACLLYAPVGKYTMVVGMGETWYGVKHFFGKEGRYLKTGTFEIKKSTAQYEVSINAKNADIPAYEISLEDSIHE